MHLIALHVNRDFVCVCVLLFFFNMFCIFAKNIDCGPHKAVLTLLSTHNDAQSSMFWSKNKKKNVYFIKLA